MPRRRLPSPRHAALLTRRRFVQSAAALAGPAWGSQAAGAMAAAGAPGVEAFAGRTSVKAGGSLDFYVRHRGGSTTVGTPVPLTIGRMGAPDRLMLSTTIRIFEKEVPARAFADGCAGWGVDYRLRVPADWPTGLYWATIGAGDAACTVPFVVRPAVRTEGVALLVQIPVTTAQDRKSVV